MSPTRKTLLFTLIGAVLGAGSVEAAIVVLKSGDVIVGKVRDGEAQEDHLTVRWPHGSIEERGKMKIDERDVRWKDLKGDDLSDAYFDEHVAKPLKGAKWLRQRKEYLIRKDPQPGEIDPVPPWFESVMRDPLETRATRGEGFSIRRPRGWSGKIEDGILIIRAPRTRYYGFRPRIHVFSVRSARVEYSTQVGWIRRELARIAGTQGFKVVELGLLRVSELGADQTMVTHTRVPKRNVAALRKVSFRKDGRTYFFTAYADARDYDAFKKLFKECLKSWRLDTDQPAR